MLKVPLNPNQYKCVMHVRSTELELSQRQSEQDRRRLWNDVLAHLVSVNSRHSDVVVIQPTANNGCDLANPTADQQLQLLADRQLSSVRPMSSSSQLQQPHCEQSSHVDFYSTGNKAGKLPCFLPLHLRNLFSF